MAKGSKALAKCAIVISGTYKDYPAAKVSGWATNLGARVHSSVNANTTHVVVSKKAWERKDAAVQTALKYNQDGPAEIYIVSFDWLEDSVTNRSKKKEGPYLWEKLDAAHSKAAKKAEKAEAVKGAKSAPGMMHEVLQGGTEGYVDERDRKKVERQIEEERRVKKQMEEEEKREKEEAKAREKRKKAEVYAKGAKKARNEIFTENHHVYMDDEGFRYDIPITKVDPRNNRNERYHLTIYESNAEPHTYAMNCQFAGTGILPSNNVMAALGCSFPVAFRAFKKTFKEKTGIVWDDRVAAALERINREKRDRGRGTGSDDAGSRRGLPVSESGVGRGGKGRVEFKDMMFVYHPPCYGPKGKLPEDKKREVIDLDPDEDARTEKVEHWMSGANGPGTPEALARSQTPQQTEELSQTQNQHDAKGNDHLSPQEADFGAETLNGSGLNGVVNGNIESNGNSEGYAAFTGTNGNSIYDNDLDEIMDTTYPFDHDLDLDNFDFDSLMADQQTQMTSAGGDLTQQQHPGDEGGTFEHHAPVPTMGDCEASFDPSMQLTEAMQQTSFLHPPSTVQESFQPGTQDVGETQVAEKAIGEFEEYLKHEQQEAQDMQGAEAGVAFTANGSFGGLLKGLNLGTSMLGKRKTSPVAQMGAEGQLMKKQRSDGDAETATAGVNSFADEGFEEAESYLFDSNQYHESGDEQTPRALAGKQNLPTAEQMHMAEQGEEIAA
ncbi:hypothetical protein LTR37_006757 [Vermiconidia calcicola]|uniref:Uncharacterized protein n=1 Tax=Vermiconidia calcicola TaxID=1690605 RepID=A0ACC3NH69_9PEZI|nr:hypothetical protein LTR37_006757 [Vermiconidia calcicola]